MSEKKNYINGVWITEKNFDDGGSILKLSILPDKLIESLKGLKKSEQGYARLVIAKSREPKPNSSHYIYEDNFVPGAQKPSNTAKPAPKTVTKAPKQSEPEEELI